MAVKFVSTADDGVSAFRVAAIRSVNTVNNELYANRAVAVRFVSMGD
jgi:hypothetical protein